MRKITMDEFHAELESQRVPRDHLAFKCPMCGTIQSADDLIRAGVGADFDAVEKYLGFSCVGRWRGGTSGLGANPGDVGCDWTLGGLFQTHKLAVVVDGREHPRFEPATPDEAQAHRTNKVHAALKAAIEVPTERSLWGDTSTVVPALADKVFGDGRALLVLTPLSTRPNFFIVRIDSGWTIGDEGINHDLWDHLADIYGALEDQFGPAEDDGECHPWPAVDLDSGSSWARADWPSLPGVELVPHPRAPGVRILAGGVE